MRIKKWLNNLANRAYPSPASDRPGIDIDAFEEVTLEENIRYLEWLMAWYGQRPSAFIANVIVNRLESLRAQARENISELDGWACQRLIQNWQYIAERRRARR